MDEIILSNVSDEVGFFANDDSPESLLEQVVIPWFLGKVRFSTILRKSNSLITSELILGSPFQLNTATINYNSTLIYLKANDILLLLNVL